MQVVSSAVGRERVHYEAPPAERVSREMADFLAWFDAAPNTDALLRAGVAHLWFVTIHLFEDGNGRIARAIADQALSGARDGAADKPATRPDKPETARSRQGVAGGGARGVAAAPRRVALEFAALPLAIGTARAPMARSGRV